MSDMTERYSYDMRRAIFFESYVRMLHVFYLRYTYIYMELNLYPSWNDRCTYIYPTDVDKTRSCVDFLYCTILDLSIIISITKSRKRQIHVLNAIAPGDHCCSTVINLKLKCSLRQHYHIRIHSDPKINCELVIIEITLYLLYMAHICKKNCIRVLAGNENESFF